MVHINNKNHLINSLHRVSKMLKPLLRMLSKKTKSPKVVEEDCVADCNAENAANEALEARLREQGATLTPCWCAPDRDIVFTCSLQIGAQVPAQQCPSPCGSVKLEQEWW